MRARRESFGTELPPQGRAIGPCARDGLARSSIAHRTTARLGGSGRGRGVVAHNAGSYRWHARSEHGGSAHASAADRAVATRDVSAWLCSPVLQAYHVLRRGGACWSTFGSAPLNTVQRCRSNAFSQRSSHEPVSISPQTSRAYLPRLCQAPRISYRSTVGPPRNFLGFDPIPQIQAGGRAWHLLNGHCSRA
jgi:hypothetical protein